jgi:outer membrane protein assembly factor BamE (lipoprotein component of BamABCDE complex)
MMVRLSKPLSGAPRWAAALAMAALVPLSACSTGGIAKMSKTTHHGYVVSQTALEQVPIGSSRDQVLIALGSPSTTADFGGEVFYYISQTKHQKAAFLPEKLVDQRVLAVYFDEKGTVTQIADYGLKDGKVFDFASQTTPTRGKDENFVQQVLAGALGGGNPFNR